MTLKKKKKILLMFLKAKYYMRDNPPGNKEFLLWEHISYMSTNIQILNHAKFANQKNFALKDLF